VAEGQYRVVQFDEDGKEKYKKGSVLVVDDEEIMREVLETLLSAEGYRVDLAKLEKKGWKPTGGALLMSCCLMYRCPASADYERLKSF
jgi:response regulator RpfG family c-di-GMP phosphodiesterase